jgi:hypothetical protein
MPGICIQSLEARRFLRYVIPGLSFAVQALLLFFILDRCWTLVQIKDLIKESGVGVAVSLFLASGGFGYLFSVLHHCAQNLFPPPLSAIDHSECVKGLHGREN